jgi:hypothetical protein
VGTNKRTSKGTNNTQARTQVQAYLRKLLGSNRQAGGWAGTGSIKLSLPKGSIAGGAGETPHTLPRQLEAMAYTKSAKNAASSGGSSFGFGNAWLISPIASTVKSILGLFGVGSSSTQTTRYRTSSRQTFRIVESISPETGSGAQNFNESAAGLTGIVSRSSTAGGVTSSSIASTKTAATALDGRGLSQIEDRQALVTALRRGLSESRGIADVLNEFQDGL